MVADRWHSLFSALAIAFLLPVLALFVLLISHSSDAQAVKFYNLIKTIEKFLFTYTLAKFLGCICQYLYMYKPNISEKELRLARSRPSIDFRLSEKSCLPRFSKYTYHTGILLIFVSFNYICIMG